MEALLAVFEVVGREPYNGSDFAALLSTYRGSLPSYDEPGQSSKPDFGP